MKMLNKIFLLFVTLGICFQVNAAEPNNLKNKVLAANCASNCESCWDQCSKSDECGVGFNCSTTPCGNRCTKQ